MHLIDELICLDPTCLFFGMISSLMFWFPDFPDLLQETQLHQFDDISTDHQELDLGCVDGSGPDNSLQISTGDLLDTFELVDVKQSLSDSDVKQEKKRSLAEASSSDAEAIKTNNSNEEFSESGGNQEDGDGNSSRGGKKPRLVWTAELHSRFMNAVNHLGVKRGFCECCSEF